MLQTFRKQTVILTLLSFALSAIPALQADSPAPRPGQVKFEVRFLTDMIEHHNMAVMMGTLCEERAVHEELRDLCHEMVAAQTSEIEQMQTWLDDWYGITHEPEMKNKDHRMMDHLADLSGEEFEIEFLTMMIRHHEKAIREGMHCVDHAYHKGLIELCESMVQTQTEEILLMEQWLCEWYDRCN